MEVLRRHDVEVAVTVHVVDDRAAAAAVGERDPRRELAVAEALVELQLGEVVGVGRPGDALLADGDDVLDAVVVEVDVLQVVVRPRAVLDDACGGSSVVAVVPRSPTT